MPENWPAVNQVVLRASVSEKPERNVRSFQPEFGPPMEGRRTSVSTDVFAFTGRVTSNEWDTLMAWYRDTLKDGSLTFTRNHPRTAAAGGTYHFMEPPALGGPHGATYREVSYRMRKLP